LRRSIERSNAQYIADHAGDKWNFTQWIPSTDGFVLETSGMPSTIAFLFASQNGPYDPRLLACLQPLLSWPAHKVLSGATWTTDAPFRETERAIENAQAQGILGVEMEAAALYAFAEARDKPVVCFAQITNRMDSVENDFE